MSDFNKVRHRRVVLPPEGDGYTFEKSDRQGRDCGPTPKQRFTCCVVPLIIVVLTGIVVALLPCPIEPSPPTHAPFVKLKGDLSVNKRLIAADRLFLDELIGPESFVVKDNVVYTGLLDGRIVAIKDNKVETFVRLGGDNCTDVYNCGRPLGLRLDLSEKNLLVADAYLGIFSISLVTGEFYKVFPLENSNCVVTFFNDLDVFPDGSIVVTESSTKFPVHRFLYDALEGRGTGRVLHINPSTGQYNVLASGLLIPNGIQRHSDGESLLIAESGHMRIIRLYIRGENKGRMDTFAFLPGAPDNIRPAHTVPPGRPHDKSYWVAISNVRYADGLHLEERLLDYPSVVSVIVKLLPYEVLHAIWKKTHGLAVRVDDTGHVVESLHDPTGTKVNVVSEVVHYQDNKLLLGSYRNPYLVMLNDYVTIKHEDTNP